MGKKSKNIDVLEIHYGLYAKYFKRFIDILFSLSALIIFLPFLLIIGILIRIKIGKPIIFRQIRAGKDEKPFEMLKFKTMLDIRDSDGRLLPDTERFSSFGNFLRNTSLDELPELINVLKGDMSLIGPRPLYTFYLPYYTNEEALRHTVRVGITGLAQVNGRSHCGWNERFAYDIEYVQNITFINDIKIFLKTILKVFLRSDIGKPGIDEEEGLHLVREIQRPDRTKYLEWDNKNSRGVSNRPVFKGMKTGLFSQNDSDDLKP